MASSSSIPLRPIPPDSPETRFLTEDNHRSYDFGEIFTPDYRSADKTFLESIHPVWKRDLHALLEYPNSSTASFFVHVFITFIILLSAVITVLETIPNFHSISTRFWFGFETSLVALFTVEYIARCIAWSWSWTSEFKWLFSFFGVIDFLAIFPYYLEIILQQDTSVLFRFSILRMFRLIRVFRPFRYNHTILLTIEVMYLSIQRSQHALFAIGFFVIMVLTIFSTLLYFAERGTWDLTLETFINSDGDPTQFASIPAAAWFVLVTITTVGYGEITPRSFLGRLVTLPLLVFGLLLIALPSFVLGREFSLVWEKMTRSQHDTDDVDSRPLFGIGPSHSSPSKDDLSNFKLAQNQTELRKQIVQLRKTVEAQNEMVRRLVEVMEKGEKGKGRSYNGNEDVNS